MRTGGSTAIFDAIIEGCDMLKKYAISHPEADLRVICLSDGQNNSSHKDVWGLFFFLFFLSFFFFLFLFLRVLF